MTAIELRDVGPRDGLQAERPVEPALRAALAARLGAAGLAHVEAASFVSPTAVPAMAGADDVVAALPQPAATTWWALVPNARGAELATAAGVRNLTITVSASEGYSTKNVGVGVNAAIAGLPHIAAAAPQAMLDVVVSCAFGSPFDDVADATVTATVVAAIHAALPAARLTLADTTGAATPRRIDSVLAALDGELDDVGLHLHDTRGTALANALHALRRGVRRFDTAIGGLGGSPFAPGAGGNLATEDLVLVLDDLGVATGVDLDRLLAVASTLPALVGHPLPSRVSAAGRLPGFG